MHVFRTLIRCSNSPSESPVGRRSMFSPASKLVLLMDETNTKTKIRARPLKHPINIYAQSISTTVPKSTHHTHDSGTLFFCGLSRDFAPVSRNFALVSRDPFGLKYGRLMLFASCFSMSFNMHIVFIYKCLIWNLLHQFLMKCCHFIQP